MPPESVQEAAEAIDAELEEAAALDPEAEAEEAQSSEEAIRVATLMGWKPKSAWKGDTANWRAADVFLAETPEIMRNTRRKAEKLEGQLARVVGEVAKLNRRSDASAVSAAKQAAREAFEAGDFDEAEKILTRAAPAAAAPDEPQALTAFKDRNDWFGVDDEATAYAAALDNKYAADAGGVTDPEAHMRKVEAGVKKRFPELFGKAPAGDEEDETQGRRRAPLVSRGSGRVDRTRTSGAMTAADLTPAQRRACAAMDVSPADYVESLNLMNKAGT